MSDFEDLRMIDLVKKFKEDVLKIEETRSAALYKQAGKNLQGIYNFHLTSKKSFKSVEGYLKNLYTSFNYSAVIVNNAVKTKTMKKEDIALLEEGIQVMLRCCDIIVATLNKK